MGSKPGVIQMTANLWSLVPAAWQDALSSCRSEIDAIDRELSLSERAGAKVLPSRDLVFASLKVSPRDVSVVILGQDPFPKAEHAIGLAFAVPIDTRPLPGSLRNVFKEVASDTGADSTANCTLSNWTEQGVLLLNTSLTTEEGVRAGHSNLPWRPVIDSILCHALATNPKVVAMMWGNSAKELSSMFDPASVVTSAHPSPLSASRGFLGSKPFTKANEILVANGRSVITW